jgi:hypothetical protein
MSKVIGGECYIDNIAAAAYLIATYRYKVIRLDGAPAQRRVFVLPAEAAKHAEEYYRHAMTPAKAFMSAYLDLRSLLKMV